MPWADMFPVLFFLPETRRHNGHVLFFYFLPKCAVAISMCCLSLHCKRTRTESPWSLAPLSSRKLKWLCLRTYDPLCQDTETMMISSRHERSRGVETWYKSLLCWLSRAVPSFSAQILFPESHSHVPCYLLFCSLLIGFGRTTCALCSALPKFT